MSGVLSGLQPEKVFHYFEELTKIPRGTSHEKKVSDYLYRWAKEKNLEVIQDQALNILIKKPGTAGYKKAPTVILQGHMDMVCEKNLDTVHDFDNDPLKLRIVDDCIYASGTTLGGDDGIAIAYAMAILDSADLAHPPLEVIITTDEECGMTGAQKLDATQIDGRILINIDSDDEGIFTAGSAGGGIIEFSIPIAKVKPHFKKFYKLTVKGLKGGHSGTDIEKERGNAIKFLGRILADFEDQIEIAEVGGGSKHNAIPRESWAVLAVNDSMDLSAMISKWNAILKRELIFSDAGVQVTLEEAKAGDDVYDQVTHKRLKCLINLIPNGPLSRDLEHNLVVYSNNLGVLTDNGHEISILCSPRSSLKSLLSHFIEVSEQMTEILKIKVRVSSVYPAWEFAEKSRIRDLCVQTYTDLYGVQGKVNVIHAGLECGFLMEKIPELDAISFGPDIMDIHSPNEHLSISSARKMFYLLCEVLKQIR